MPNEGYGTKKMGGRTTVGQWLAAGTGGAAMMGIGVVLSLSPGHGAPPRLDVVLTSTESSLSPEGAGSEQLWLFGWAGSDRRDAAVASTTRTS